MDAAASAEAAKAHGSVTEFVVNRFPTSQPSHSRSPTHGPTLMPAAKVPKVPAEEEKVKGASWGSPNPWLVVVIGLEVAISIALCVCCMKVGQRPPGPITDPMALTALAVSVQ